MRIKFAYLILMIKNIPKYLLLFISLQFISLCLPAQMMDNTNGSKNFKPEFRRLINHEAIDKEQNNILAADGRTDDQFVASANEEINMLLTNALIGAIDDFQYNTETDSLLDHRLKVNSLAGMGNMLKYIRLNWYSKRVNVFQLPTILEAYEHCVKLNQAGKSIGPVIQSLTYDAGTAVLASGIFEKNTGYHAAKDLLLLKYCALKPAETFVTLRNNPNVPFADSLVKVVAGSIRPNYITMHKPVINWVLSSVVLMTMFL